MLVFSEQKNLILYFIWGTKMAAKSVVFCVSWDCVKNKNSGETFHL